MRRIRALALAGLLWPAPALAGVRVASVEWQLSRPAKKPAERFVPVEALKIGPGQKVGGRARAVVTVMNEGARPLEGVVLRYAVSARLAPIEGASEPRWVVPFRAEERRIPVLKPGQPRRVPIDTIRLEAYLKGIRSSGYWPVALRIEVMVEPKPGLTLENALAEAVLPVEWH